MFAWCWEFLFSENSQEIGKVHGLVQHAVEHYLFVIGDCKKKQFLKHFLSKASKVKVAEVEFEKCDYEYG